MFMLRPGVGSNIAQRHIDWAAYSLSGTDTAESAGVALVSEGPDTWCARCGAVETREAWDQVVDGRLAWTIEYRCPMCPDTQVSVACGWDRADPGTRAEILRQRGEFRLRVTAGAGWSRMELLRLLRKDGAGMDEVRSLADRVLAGEMTGTEGEMGLLADRIRPAGLSGVVAANN